MIRQYRVGLPVCLAALVLAAAGCGRSPRATVSGKVTVGGKVVTAGTVVFVGDKNQIVTARLDGEGRYVALRVPMGSVKVAVQTLQPSQLKAAEKRPKGARPLPSPLTNLVPVPPKYGDPETSGLTCDVRQTQQEHNIDLP